MSREDDPTWDFRQMPKEWDRRFDVVAYDPPYVSAGGRKTTTIPSMHQAYGMDDAPTTPALLQDLINDGLLECRRVTRPGGLILVKCQDYISSGKLWSGTFRTHFAANAMRLKLIDRFEHLGGVRPQPSGRRVMHARRNLSTLFVFQKGK
jgi:DNA modification methylase